MSGWGGLVVFAADRLRTLLVGERFVVSVASLVGFVFLVELLTERRWRRYLTRVFLTDFLYFLFFTGGFYYFLFSGPMDRALKTIVTQQAPFLLLNVLGWLPDVPKALLFIAIIDGFEYAIHRLYHRYDWLWCFHCVHHSPSLLTPFGKFRVHFVDMTLFGLAKAVPMLVLGSLNVTWMPFVPVVLVRVFSHFDIDLHFGPIMGRILVSPRYHRVHHSSDPAQYNKNFGCIFSFWDYLFGTAAEDLSRPREYGLRDPRVPEGFFRQQFFPFLLLAQRLGLSRPRPEPTVAPAG